MEPFQHPDVENTFLSYPETLRKKLLHMRELIFRTAVCMEGVGEIKETLKWGQPSYLTPVTRSGTTIRIDQLRYDPRQYGMFVHCQTSLLATYQALYGDTLNYEGKRCITFSVDDDPSDEILQHCIALALTYHLCKRRDRLPF